MKIAPPYYTANSDKVNAYERADILKLAPVFAEAKQAWLAEWRAQGAEDHGTCCGGKGLVVWYVAPRKRIAEKAIVVSCDFVQGNVSAQRSKEAALAVLKAHGIEARYDDGWMD